MARIKLNLPEYFSFNTEIKVRITDLNYGGHVGNDTVLGLMHESRVQYLNHLGYDNEVDAIGGFGLIQTDAAIVYKSETFYGEILLVEIAVEDFSKYGFDIVYKLSNAANDREVARGKTGMICFDYASRSIVTLSEEFKKKLQGMSS